jgi:threonine dehydratase
MAEKAELAFGAEVGQVSWQMVQQARQWIRQHLPRTPLLECPELPERLGIRVLLKLENLQWTGAFKVRGGLVKLLSVPEEVRQRGVVCASTGNHGKGVAFLAQRFGIPAWVVVPETTPPVKTHAIEAFGARLIRFGETYAQAETFAKALAQERRLLFVPSFDDPFVVAAKATIAWEILEDAPEVDTLIVPVGGGALLAGSLLTAHHLKPSLRVIGVEAEGAAALTVSLQAGEPVTLPSVANAGGWDGGVAPWGSAFCGHPSPFGGTDCVGHRRRDDGSGANVAPSRKSRGRTGRRCCFGGVAFRQGHRPA